MLETLEYLKHETDVWFEITNLLIPGLNDSDEELDRLTGWVVERLGPDVPLHFTAFHPDYKLLDRPPTPASTLTRARAIARANGVRHAYTGNVHDRDGGSTYCSGCGLLVIERDWYRLGAYRLTDDGRCRGCGLRLPGVFAGSPGQLGAETPPGPARDDGGVSGGGGPLAGSAAGLVAEQHALASRRRRLGVRARVAVGACFVCFERAARGRAAPAIRRGPRRRSATRTWS